MKKLIKCHYCGHEKEVDTCDTCQGKGYSQRPLKHDPLDYFVNICRDCNGTGVKNGKIVMHNY